MRDRQAVMMKEFVIKGVERLELGSNQDITQVKNQLDNPRWSHPNSNELKTIQKLLDGVHYYYWNPRFMALPVAPDSKRRFRMEPNGFGLALCLDEILSFDRDQFIQLEKRFTKDYISS
jgi:hypothetical protein